MFDIYVLGGALVAVIAILGLVAVILKLAKPVNGNGYKHDTAEKRLNKHAEELKRLCDSTARLEERQGSIGDRVERIDEKLDELLKRSG